MFLFGPSAPKHKLLTLIVVIGEMWINGDDSCDLPSLTIVAGQFEPTIDHTT